MDIVSRFIVESDQVPKAENRLRKMGIQAQKTAKDVKGVNEQARTGVPVFKKYRGASSALTNTTGQLSVQIQDVAVQLESGTDALRVFAQQGPQIASIFGPQGALFGALLAVGALIAGPFIRSLFDSGEAIDDLVKKAKDLEVNLQKEFPLIFAEKMEELTEKEREAAVETANLAAEIANEEALIESLQKRLERAGGGHPRLKQMIVDSRAEVVELNRELEEEQLNLQNVQAQIAELMGFQSEEDKMLQTMRETLDQLVEKLKEEVATYGMGEMALIAYNAEKFKKLGLDTAEYEQLQRTLLLKKNEEDAEKRLARFRAERAKLEENARKKRESGEEREAARDKKAKEAEAKRVEDFQRSVNEKRFALIVEAREKRIEEEEKQAKEAMEREEEREKFMATIREQRFENIQNAANERRQREADARKKEEEEEIASRERVTNALLGLEDKLMKGKTEKQKAAFRLGVNLANAEKRQNAATILSDSYSAAMKAYKALAGIPFVGPALGAAAAGVIIAAGASYATQSLAGRALGGQVREGESYVVGERGPEVLTMGSSGRIIPNDKLRGEQQVVNKTANITFQVNTVDARGFDQLLQSRRGQIISMVNTAMNDKGRRGVV